MEDPNAMNNSIEKICLICQSCDCRPNNNKLNRTVDQTPLQWNFGPFPTFPILFLFIHLFSDLGYGYAIEGPNDKEMK